MSNYYGAARSNYFAVKDKERFKEFCDRWNVEFIEHKENPELVGFLCYDNDGCLPTYLEAEATVNGQLLLFEEELNFDNFLLELADQLTPGHVAVMVEAGAEKLRYVGSYAVAVNHRGTFRQINIDEIYSRAKSLGKHITHAHY